MSLELELSVEKHVCLSKIVIIMMKILLLPTKQLLKNLMNTLWILKTNKHKSLNNLFQLNSTN